MHSEVVSEIRIAEKRKKIYLFRQWQLRFLQGDLSVMSEIFDAQNKALRIIFFDIYGYELSQLFAGEKNEIGLVLTEDTAIGSYKIKQHPDYKNITETPARKNARWHSQLKFAVKLLAAGIRDGERGSVKRAYSMVSEVEGITEKQLKRHWAAFKKQEAFAMEHYTRIAETTKEFEDHLMTKNLGTVFDK